MKRLPSVSWLKPLLKGLHKKRQQALLTLSVALMRGGRLGVAAIGRFRATRTSDKHHIKAVDRFLASEVELDALFCALTRLACAASSKRLFVLLD
jgi:hypothetical protein